MKTDDLIEKILGIGVAMPTYDYEYRMFISHHWINEKIGDRVTAIPVSEMHDTFREACEFIIQSNHV